MSRNRWTAGLVNSSPERHFITMLLLDGIRDAYAVGVSRRKRFLRNGENTTVIRFGGKLDRVAKDLLGWVGTSRCEWYCNILGIPVAEYQQVVTQLLQDERIEEIRDALSRYRGVGRPRTICQEDGTLIPKSIPATSPTFPLLDDNLQWMNGDGNFTTYDLLKNCVNN